MKRNVLTYRQEKKLFKKYLCRNSLNKKRKGKKDIKGRSMKTFFKIPFLPLRFSRLQILYFCSRINLKCIDLVTFPCFSSIGLCYVIFVVNFFPLCLWRRKPWWWKMCSSKNTSKATKYQSRISMIIFMNFSLTLLFFYLLL